MKIDRASRVNLQGLYLQIHEAFMSQSLRIYATTSEPKGNLRVAKLGMSYSIAYYIVNFDQRDTIGPQFLISFRGWVVD